jgi:hypothetical protein
MLDEPLPMLLSDWLLLPVEPWPLEPLELLCFLDFFFALWVDDELLLPVPVAD